ncbi:hypothetical protein Tsubulata_028358 [Turnera subulata]|uniref:Uncharacterized protein n=1 Tax=Turnera subulata TaxID=218843 RepID=A0A9Q0G0Q3_9ROSI|nr:hypothetical protein Tsubulata_028358 [Turnera subulata]
MFVILLIVISQLLVISESRPLCISAGSNGGSAVYKGIGIFFDGLYIQGIKTGGPSGGGKGHALTDQIRRFEESSGPSPGEGH